jgi:hypothetical protein
VWCNLDSFGSTLHLGVTVGQTWGDSFQKDPDPAAGIFGTDVAFDTFFVGPYAAFTRGNFAAQASLRFDYHSLELSNPTVGVDADGLDVDAEGISGSASMSYDFELATLTLTPDVGVNVSNTEIDSFDIAGGTVVLDDLWSVMGHAGVTARTQPLGVADNLFVVPFASATLYHEFIEHADGQVRYRRHGDQGRVEPGGDVRAAGHRGERGSARRRRGRSSDPVRRCALRPAGRRAHRRRHGNRVRPRPVLIDVPPDCFSGLGRAPTAAMVPGQISPEETMHDRHAAVDAAEGAPSTPVTCAASRTNSMPAMG